MKWAVAEASVFLLCPSIEDIKLYGSLSIDDKKSNGRRNKNEKK